jgi:hypothetical protein
MPEPVPNVAELAALIAQQLQARGLPAAAAVKAPAAGGAITAAGVSSVGGSADIAIKVGTTTYELTVAVPTSTSPDYVFMLTMTPEGKPADTIATFKYKDGANWSVEAGLPVIKINDRFSITKLSIKLQDGTP